MVAAIAVTGCGRRREPAIEIFPGVLRIGVGGLGQQTQQIGLRQVGSNLSLEGLLNFNEDGRPRPWLAESWKTTPDGLALVLQLRPQAKFSDGAPVTASDIVDALKKSLPSVMGPAYEDVDQILAPESHQVLIKLRQPSRFLIEALESNVQKPGKDGIGTGPYVAVDSATTPEFRASADYYLGRPKIDRITLTPYPNVRAAWAELLRDKIDMLYEVNADALDSLQASNDVSVFSYMRHYQYVIMFGPRATNLRASAVRRELNAAIDREALIRDALNGHGISSSGPVPPRHWALDTKAPKFRFDPLLASNLAQRHLQFTCLVPADSVYERIALVVKRQLAAAGVDMRVVETTQDQLLQAGRNNDFDAILIDAISGPSVFRSYRHLYSKVQFTPKPLGSARIDAALDGIRRAASDDAYRQAVSEFQRTVVDDPPEIFLAWGERARAISRRFDVPAPEDGRDVLATLRMWQPASAKRIASN